MEWITEVLKEHLGSFIGMVLSGLAGWFFGRPKQQMELQTSELDNVDKAVKIYREMIEDLGAKYANAIDELKKANQRIKDLEASVEELLTELKKYKQLNGKAK
nr:MAG TPA: YtxH-like protein [Bacteriophage sp.]